MWNRNMTLNEAAQIIERFSAGNSLHPQEWNDFVETPQCDERVERYRKRCNKLDPVVNCP